MLTMAYRSFNHFYDLLLFVQVYILLSCFVLKYRRRLDMFTLIFLLFSLVDLNNLVLNMVDEFISLQSTLIMSVVTIVTRNYIFDGI